MSGDNPFAEPNDNERTIVHRPVPGGRSPAAPPGGFAPPSAESAPVGAAPVVDTAGPLLTGQSPLVIAATPLLRLLGRLRNTFNPPDPGGLRARTVQAIRDFETAGRAAAIAHEVLHPARYALCASIDDVVLHTPWGAASPWVQASLVSTFHQEVVSGEGFFHQLASLKRDPARNLMLLELIYLCLSLGYQGQYRLSRRGPAELELLREDLYQTLVRLRAPYEQGLSPHWQGIDAPYKPARAFVPVWVMAVVALTVVVSSWLYLRNAASAASEDAWSAAQGMPPAQMPTLERPPPPRDPTPRLAVVKSPEKSESTVVATLHRFLQSEIDAHLVLVTDSPTTVKVRIFNSGTFKLGKADVEPAFVSLLERIGEALNDEPGDVLVAGYTDNLPILNRVPFASNYELSVARARAAQAIILRKLRDPTRLTAKGFGDSDPVHDNATDEHRAENRRIDVTLSRRNQ
jgi:type VI secretion system protein ImpK